MSDRPHCVYLGEKYESIQVVFDEIEKVPFFSFFDSKIDLSKIHLIEIGSDCAHEEEAANKSGDKTSNIWENIQYFKKMTFSGSDLTWTFIVQGDTTFSSSEIFFEKDDLRCDDRSSDCLCWCERPYAIIGLNNFFIDKHIKWCLYLCIDVKNMSSNIVRQILFLRRVYYGINFIGSDFSAMKIVTTVLAFETED